MLMFFSVRDSEIGGSVGAIAAAAFLVSLISLKRGGGFEL